MNENIEIRMLIRFFLVPVEEVVVVPPYRPRIPIFMPRGIPLLKDNLEINMEDGTVNSNVAAVKAALIIYLQNGYGESHLEEISN